MNIEDTIAAVSTPEGYAALGVIRVSGDRCREILSRVFIPDSKLKPEDNPRRTLLGKIIDPATGRTADKVVLTFYAAPASYSGEDMLEISAHGNPLILAKIMNILAAQKVRSAAPGEFTYRAFLNRKIDLTQAEALNSLIGALTLPEAENALRQVEGSLGKKLREWKEALVGILSRIEADIEFSADSDEPFTDIDSEEKRAMKILIEAEEVLKSYQSGMMLRRGADVVIAGRPNTGKSTLFNRLLESERAIVNELPGTTRDVITETIEIDGLPVRLYDTAGLAEYERALEKEGVRRAKEQMEGAQLVILLLDGSEKLSAEDTKVLRATDGKKRITVINKSDLRQHLDRLALPPDVSRETISISALTGDGVGQLKKAIIENLGWRKYNYESSTLLQSPRQQELLLRFRSELTDLVSELQGKRRGEIISLHILASLKPLDEVLGATAPNDIYEHIFSNFCIGK